MQDSDAILRLRQRLTSKLSLRVLTVCILLTATVALVVAPASAQTADETELSRIVERFFFLYQRKAADDLMALCDPASPDRESMKQRFNRIFAANDMIEVKGLRILSIKVESNLAVVRVHAEFTGLDAVTRRPSNGAGFGLLDRTLRCVSTAG